MTKKPQVKATKHRSHTLLHWAAALAAVVVAVRNADHGMTHAAAVATVTYVLVFVGTRTLFGGRK